MNIGVTQIRGALINFYKEKVPFYISAGHCLQFLKWSLNHVRISKYKNNFGKGYFPNWSKVFVIKTVKNTVS